MPDLIGPPAELSFTVTVTDPVTHQSQTYQMVGWTNPQEPKKETENGSNS